MKLDLQELQFLMNRCHYYLDNVNTDNDGMVIIFRFALSELYKKLRDTETKFMFSKKQKINVKLTDLHKATLAHVAGLTLSVMDQAITPYDRLLLQHIFNGTIK